MLSTVKPADSHTLSAPIWLTFENWALLARRMSSAATWRRSSGERCRRAVTGAKPAGRRGGSAAQHEPTGLAHAGNQSPSEQAKQNAIGLRWRRSGARSTAPTWLGGGHVFIGAARLRLFIHA